jgi:uroporphyrin-III C-methyltransferase
MNKLRSRKHVHLARVDLEAPAKKPGTVFLVGAGPGNPDLLTVRAHRLITSASVIAHDELVASEILDLAPRTAELFSVGRRALPTPKNCQVQNTRIHPAVIARALAGHDVIRLKGGDPYIFGRGGEEAEALEEAGIPFEVVPGISAALGAAASIRVPLTFRNEATSVTLATAHAASEDGDQAIFSAIPDSGTVVFYMGLARLEATLAQFIARGRSAETPAILISHATLSTERFVEGTVSTLAALARAADLPAPALLIVGEAVAHRAVTSPSSLPARALRNAKPSALPTASISHGARAQLESSVPQAARARELHAEDASARGPRPKMKSTR